MTGFSQTVGGRSGRVGIWSSCKPSSRNAGSPSGFSFENAPGPRFCASNPTQHFDLPIFDCAPIGAVHVGDTPTLAVGELPVHPEMADLHEGGIVKSGAKLQLLAEQRRPAPSKQEQEELLRF